MTRVTGFVLVYLFSAFSHAMAQNSADDKLCGAKSLYVALRSLGKAPDRFERLVTLLGPVPSDGYSILELQAGATKLKCDAIALKLDVELLKTVARRNEVILHFVPGHFLLLGGFDAGKVLLFESDRRSISLTEEEFSRKWNGNCLAIGVEPIQIPTRGFAWYGYLLVVLLLFGSVGIIRLLKSLSRSSGS